MNNTVSRLSGTLLIVAALGGLVFSLLGLVGVWRYRPTVTDSLTGSLELLRTTLDSTDDGLAITQESLRGAVASISALQDALTTTTATIQSTEPMVETVAALLDEDLPQTIQATQNSLNTAQESAKVIDGFLNALSLIPGVRYAPQVPLSEALQQVSTSLNGLPGSLAEMANSLEDTGDNLQIIQVDLALIADSVSQVEASLAKSEAVIVDYQESIATVQEQLDISEAKLPKLIQNTAIGLSFFLAWMAIAQIGLFTQGWDLARRGRGSTADDNKDN